MKERKKAQMKKEEKWRKKKEKRRKKKKERIKQTEISAPLRSEVNVQSEWAGSSSSRSSRKQSSTDFAHRVVVVKYTEGNSGKDAGKI